VTYAVAHPTTSVFKAALRCWRFIASLARSLHRAALTHSTRRALDELPDKVLHDLGLARGDIPFVAAALASGDSNLGRDLCGRLSLGAVERDAAAAAISSLRWSIATPDWSGFWRSIWPEAASYSFITKCARPTFPIVPSYSRIFRKIC